MNYKGALYIVATPIGNLHDITLRAITVLNSVETVLCEDTRQTKKIFAKHNIKTKNLIPLNEFNEENVLFEAVRILENADVALVSDAGTPLISDPGFRLVSEAKKRGIKVIPIPGPSAVIAALSSSGLPTDKFVFLGFLPKTRNKAENILKKFTGLKTTIVLYESPHRIIPTLKLIEILFGDIDVTLARELTKVHEEILSEPASKLIQKYENNKPRGEFVILLNIK